MMRVKEQRIKVSGAVSLMAPQLNDNNWSSMKKIMVSKKVLALSVGVSLLALVGCDGAEDREAKYLNKAQVYFDDGNYEKMRVELKNVLQINPKNVDARYLSALAAEKSQDWRKMYGTLLAVVEAKPDHHDAQLKLGKLLLFSKEYDKALEKSEMVLAVEPNNADALALKATVHLAKKEKTEAMAFLKQALEAEPGHYEVSLLMIKMLGDEKDIEGAKQILEASLAAHPDKLKLSLVKINILLIEEKKAEAEALYQSLIEKNPENESLYYNLAKLYMTDKKVDQAEGVLKKLVKQVPDSDQPKFVLIDFLNRQRGKEQTEKELDKLINENPENFGFRFAKLPLYKDQPEKIQQILEQIVEDDKLGASGLDARNKLAKLFLAKGDKEQARKMVDEIVELDSKNTDALLLRAGLLVQDKDFDGALADARSVLRESPDSEKALMILAIAQLQSKNIELAQETFEKIVLINPKNLVAIKDLARIKVQLKDEEGAIKLLEKAQTLFKNDVDVSVMLVDLYGKKQEWEKAEDVAKGLLENAEVKELPHFKLAQLYMGQQKFEEAIEEYSKVLETKPNAADVIGGIVNAHLALKQTAKAEKILDKALAENKDNLIFLTMRAELYRQMQKYSDAERLFNRVIELRPEVELGYKNLATVYQAQKQLDNLIKVFEQGVVAIPESGAFYMQLGILNTIAGDTTKAIDAYQSVLKLFPDNLLAVNNLAALLVESEDPKHIEQASELVPALKDSEYSAFLDTYGWTSYKTGNIDEALNALESVMQKEGIIPEMHYHLAMVYINKGRVEEAKMELEKAVVEGAKYGALDSAKAELEKLKAM